MLDNDSFSDPNTNANQQVNLTFHLHENKKAACFHQKFNSQYLKKFYYKHKNRIIVLCFNVYHLVHNKGIYGNDMVE